MFAHDTIFHDGREKRDYDTKYSHYIPFYEDSYGPTDRLKLAQHNAHQSGLKSGALTYPDACLAINYSADLF
jgi:hypothetical protein